jgi:hypothetical protein
MSYDQQILQILTSVGERGISVAMLTKHVYNMNCTFFHQPDLHELRQSVRQFLIRNSHSSQSLIESTGKRGYYRLNTGNSSDARQLMFEFLDECEPEDVENDNLLNRKMAQDLSLPLFDDEDL